MPVVKRHLSSSPSGLGIKMSSSNSAALGQIIHTHNMSYEDSLFDVVHLHAYNSHTSSVTINIQWGGLVTPDNIINITVGANSFLNIVCGLPISGKKIISATASVANKIVIYGYVFPHVEYEKAPNGTDSAGGLTGSGY